jgi:branched-chain amino acid transport system permease protein
MALATPPATATPASSASPPGTRKSGTGLPPVAWRALATALLLVAACALPFAISNYLVFQLTLVIIYAIALLGLNILAGFNGQISLGHGAFFAVGAYTAAILLDKAGMPFWATIPIAAAICLVAGFLFGIPALRLEGHYLALATFSLAIVVPQLLKFRGLEHWTGGVQGLVIDRGDVPAGLPLNNDQWFYFVCLAIAVVMFVLGANLLRGRIGRAIVAIRDHPIAAASMGIDTARYKAMTFGISAMYTGIAGALSALLAQFVSPDSFSFFLSISLLVGAVVGGVASIWGAVFGAFFIVYVPNWADQLTKAAPWAIYGLVLLGFMYAMPQGLAGLMRLIGKRLARR